MRRVVVTGMGIACGAGSNVEEYWNTLITCRAPRRSTREYFSMDGGTRPYSTPEGPIETVCGSPLPDQAMRDVLTSFAPKPDKQKTPFGNPKRFDRHQLFAAVASIEAMRDARLLDHDESDRFGCVLGTGSGGLQETYDAAVQLHGNKRVGPDCNLRFLPNIFAGYLSQQFRLRGPNHVHTTACAAAAHAQMHAADLIRADRADIVLTGGAEAAITPTGIASFCAQRALSNQSRPYQIERKGFLMGEGAGMTVFEEYEHAIRRGATIYAEVAGWGATADGNPDAQITDPGTGGLRSMELALKMASINAHEISYINAHGTGTPGGDEFEIANIQALAGLFARYILLSSTKSQIGHLLGAAAAAESIATILMVRNSVVLPTVGLTPDNLDAKCAGVQHVMLSPQPAELKYALSNSFGFGGTNASLVFRSIDA